ncbi:phosphotriesterase family protein [Saccharopolyspora sp. NPDC002376]
MPSVMTASGSVDRDRLGPTLPHEHLFINLLRERRGDGLIVDEQLVTEEVGAFAELGGGTIVDLTSAELTIGAAPVPSNDATGSTRDPQNVLAIGRVAKASGLNVVLGTGHYRDPFLEQDWFDRHDPDQIAEHMVRDLTEGFPGTDISAGIIGEIGADKWYISAAEERSFRAAARAHRATGAAIYTHAARWPVGLPQLDLLAEEDVAPERIAIGHCDLVEKPGYALEIARRGAYVGIDTMFTANPHEVSRRVAMVVELARAGHLDQILLSHDVCVKSQLSAYGGTGYAFVQTVFRKALREAGIDDGEFEHITVANPAQLLCG